MKTPFNLNTAETEDPLSNFEPVQYDCELERALAEDSAGAIVAQPYLCVSPSTTVRQAIKSLEESKVSCLLVVQDNRLIGVFTERDVLEKAVEQYGRVSENPVSDLMTSDPTIVYQSDPAAAAAAAIAVAGHRHVPVLDMDDNVVGVVSPRRVFDFMEAHF